MTMTPYEIGRITGQLRAPLDTEISISSGSFIAHSLGMEGEQKEEFLEGYRNGFTETKSPSWLPSAAEINEAEREMIELDESLKAEEALARARRAQKAIESPAWQAYLRGEFDR